MSAGNLPVLPDTGAVRNDAAAIDASGQRAKGYGQDLVAAWTGLQDSYQAPEQDIVHGAMAKAAVYTDATADVTGAIRDALEAYADAVDALRPRYDALLAALHDHACRPLDDDSQESASAARSEEARLTRESASIAAELQAAEDACAAAISSLHTSFSEPHRVATSPYAAVAIHLASTDSFQCTSTPAAGSLGSLWIPVPTGASSMCPAQSPCG